MKTKLPSWKDIIYRAKQRGYFLKDHVRLAGCWPTCAVGEYASKNKLITHIVVDDPTISRLGNNFDSAVIHQDLGSISTIYRDIRRQIRLRFLGGSRQ